ncbi:MAG: hypothetical protein WD534_11560 [Phycisphaeraceae bacterium]
MHHRRPLTLLMFLTLALLMAGGCVSRDRHVFESTPDRPTSVSVIDALDRETLWSMDVPPEHLLIVQFDRSGEVSAASVTGRPATSMDWSLYRVGRHIVGEDGRRRVSGDSLQLEGRPVRLEVDYQAPAQRDPLPEEDADEADDLDDTPPGETDVETAPDADADEQPEPADEAPADESPAL